MTQPPADRPDAPDPNADRPGPQTPDPDEEPPARRPRPAAVDVDPEDWAASSGTGDERILRERPPHW
jgi:hypothetical protein